MTYFAASVALTANTAALVADTDTVDRVVHSTLTGANYGFTSSTAFFLPTPGESFVLPAGEQLWAKTSSSGISAVVLISKSDASVSLCGN